MDHQQRTLAHLLGAVVLGAVAAVDPGGWYPFGPTKWLVVATGIAVSTAYAAWVGLRPRLPRWTVVVGLGVLAWTAVAAALGRDPLYAWIGTPERRFGFATSVLLAACAALGSMLSVSAVRVWVRWVAAATLCLLVPVSGWVASDRHQSHAWRVIGGGGAVLGAVALASRQSATPPWWPSRSRNVTPTAPPDSSCWSEHPRPELVPGTASGSRHQCR